MKHFVLNLLLLIAAVLFGYMIWPYVTPLVLAIVVAVLGYPLHGWLHKKLKDKGSASATLSTIIIVVVIGIPLSVFAALLTKEAVETVLWARNYVAEENVSQLTQSTDLLYIKNKLESVGFMPDIDIQKIQQGVIGATQQLSGHLIKGAGALATGIANTVVGLTIFVIALFFLLRDGGSLVSYFRNSTLIENRVADRLIKRFREVVDAIVFGNLTIAALQGLVVGISFPLFGMSNALLIGLTTSILALIPAVGPLLVIFPAAGYLWVSSGWVTALIFAAITIVITGIIDNVVKPIVLERRLHVHPLIVFLSLFGGISVFGVLGILYGPLIAALFLTLLDLRLKQA